MPVKPRFSKQRGAEIEDMELFLRDGRTDGRPELEARAFDTRFWKVEIPAALDRLRPLRGKGFFRWAEGYVAALRAREADHAAVEPEPAIVVARPKPREFIPPPPAPAIEVPPQAARASFIPDPPEPEPPPPPPPPTPREPPRSWRASIGAATPEGYNGTPPSTDAPQGNVEPIVSETCRNCGRRLRGKRLIGEFCRARCVSEFDQESLRLQAREESIDRELSRPRRPPFWDECKNWLHHRTHLVQELEEARKALRGRHHEA